MKSILLTGGAGYIGAHTAYLLTQQDYHVIILDSFLHGKHAPMPWATVIQGDYADQLILRDIFSRYQIETVMHFAALIEVGESVKKPREFYENNVVKTIRLLNAVCDAGVQRFIFSSSCAVYGIPQYIPIDEHHPCAPTNPYGKTKLVIDYALQDYAKSYGLNFVSLRYFNAAGAWPEKGLGESHHPETHVIPLLLRAIEQGIPFLIFGDDYETSDGTCVRDYVHVRDIAHAHLLALQYLERGGSSDFFNLGSGVGFSVKQLVECAERITKRKAYLCIQSRRDGDVPVLLANAVKIERILGWKQTHSDIETIIASAYEWEVMLGKK